MRPSTTGSTAFAAVRRAPGVQSRHSQTMAFTPRLVTAAIMVLSVAMMTCRSSQTYPVPAGQPPAPLPGHEVTSTPGATYVGSTTCRTCHAAIYDRWSKTRMANVVVDPRQRPGVVIPDFSKPDPLRTFNLDAVALVYGSKWKQRYFTKVGNDY